MKLYGQWFVLFLVRNKLMWKMEIFHHFWNQQVQYLLLTLVNVPFWLCEKKNCHSIDLWWKIWKCEEYIGTEKVYSQKFLISLPINIHLPSKFLQWWLWHRFFKILQKHAWQTKFLTEAQKMFYHVWFPEHVSCCNLHHYKCIWLLII